MRSTYRRRSRSGRRRVLYPSVEGADEFRTAVLPCNLDCSKSAAADRWGRGTERGETKSCRAPVIARERAPAAEFLASCDYGSRLFVASANAFQACQASMFIFSGSFVRCRIRIRTRLGRRRRADFRRRYGVSLAAANRGGANSGRSRRTCFLEYNPRSRRKNGSRLPSALGRHDETAKNILAVDGDVFLHKRRSATWPTVGKCEPNENVFQKEATTHWSVEAHLFKLPSSASERVGVIIVRHQWRR